MTMRLTPEQEQGIRQRLAAATPGPWQSHVTEGDVRADSSALPVCITSATRGAFARWGLMGDYRGVRIAYAACNPTMLTDSRYIDGMGDHSPYANAALIANAPADLSALLEEVAALREDAKLMQAVRESEMAALAKLRDALCGPEFYPHAAEGSKRGEDAAELALRLLRQWHPTNTTTEASR